jgi:alkylhydroperoxidase family enzyme
LRAEGLTDSDILDITLVVAYFNFVNRIALGLGVGFTLEELSGYKED